MTVAVASTYRRIVGNAYDQPWWLAFGADQWYR